LISGRAINENVKRLVTPASRNRSAPKVGFDGISRVQVRDGDLSSEHGLDRPRAGRDMKQLDLQAVFLKDAVLVSNPKAALAPRHGGPINPDFHLRPRGRRRDE